MGRRINGLAHIDVFDLVASLRDRMTDFDKVTLRQEWPGSPHHDTRAIILRGPVGLGRTLPLPAGWFDDVPHEDLLPRWDWPEVRDVLREIEKLAPVGLGKAMIVALRPGGSIDWHVDEGPYAQAHLRYHLPLVTNPFAHLYSGGEQAHVPVGALTFFDTSVLHSATNLGPTDRIHLIVDARKVRKEG